MRGKNGKTELIKLRDYAKLLYTRDRLTQAEIGIKTGLHCNTINNWATAGGWKKLQRNFRLTCEKQVACLLDELGELNASILDKPNGKRFADAGESSVRRKLLCDINDLDPAMPVSKVMDNCKPLVTFIHEINPAIGIELLGWVDQYIRSLVVNPI